MAGRDTERGFAWGGTMANPEHVEVIEQGADAIRAWRKSYPAEQLQLSGADLSEANLTGADLRPTAPTRTR